jgi:twinkle protein
MATTRTWADVGIEIHGKGPGPEIKTLCPRCSHTRKKRQYPCLSVNLDKGVWHCWHCEWSGSLAKGSDIPPIPYQPPKAYRRPTYAPSDELPAEVLQWFLKRGIPEAIMRRHRIGYGRVYMPQLEEEVWAIQFPYYRQGEIVNIKYRDFRKNFRMVGGAERILYGLDDVQGDSLIWVEGELDKMAVEVAGYLSCVSVPDGAPSPTTKHYQAKFDYLSSAEAILARITRHIIGVDHDPPGERLAEELIRRLGPERCWRVRWARECKDANEVLMRYGAEVLAACIRQAEPCPIAGIVTIDNLSEAIDRLYVEGLPRGVSPGWEALKRYYTVRPGEVTLVTGIPSHGKTGFLSALLINLAMQQEWVFAVCSPENLPLERYAARLLEMYTAEPFSPGPTPRMTPETLQQAKAWLASHVTFLMPEEHSPTVAHLLELARTQVFRLGINGVVIDPWNELDHSRPAHLLETEYISHALSQIRQFARQHQVHVWLVAHPTKLAKDHTGKYPVPTAYDISGSAHWRNKADNVLAIWRDVTASHHRVQVHVQKIRFREVGQVGMIELEFEPRTGRFHEPGAWPYPRHP